MNSRKLHLFSLLICLLQLANTSYSQNSVGIGTANSNPNAVLELVSPGNDQGFLVPRLTTVERTAGTLTTKLSSADNGLLVYDSDEEKFYFWVDTQWMGLSNASGLTAGSGIDITSGVISVTGDADTDPLNEIQDLSLSGNNLSITNNALATPIDLSSYIDNTDSQDLANVLAAGNDAGGLVISNLNDPTNAQDAVTKNYVDGLAGSGWGINGNSGTDPTKNYLGTTDANDVVFGRAGVEGMRLADTGLGIGTNKPLGAIHVNGSHYETPTVLDFTSITDYTVGTKDYLVIVRANSGGSGNITLPALSASPGRVIQFRVIGDSKTSFAIKTSGSDTFTDFFDDVKTSLVLSNTTSGYSFLTIVAANVNGKDTWVLMDWQLN